MICARCRETLVATDGALRGWAHAHGAADHDAEPVEACAVCGGSGHLDVTHHGLACLVRGCGPDAGCVLVSVACRVCERNGLSDDLNSQTAPASLGRFWTWVSGLVIPPAALRLAEGARAPARGPLFGPEFDLQGCNYINVSGRA